MKNPPVKLAKIAIGNGAMGDMWEMTHVPVVRVAISTHDVGLYLTAAPCCF